MAVPTAGKYGRKADDIIMANWCGPDAKSAPAIATLIEAAVGKSVDVKWVQNRACAIGAKRHPKYLHKARHWAGAGGRPRGGNYGSQCPGERGEGPIKLPEWPEFKGRFADVGRIELIREMLPIDRFRALPSVPLRYSASGCAAAML